ncbi:MAG: GNAT family N-acetyltransferase [Roseburia sp.]|nr:GNAT family N-acetyltransferase [Roseburia sp.]
MENKKETPIRFDADDLIYNRFDMLYPDDNSRFVCVSHENSYAIDMHVEGTKAFLNVWGKTYPQEVFEEVVRRVFDRKDIGSIHIQRGGNHYRGFLQATNDMRILLPDTPEGLTDRMRAKHRSNIRRMERELEKEGPVSLVVYSEKIPDDVVKQYFRWKMATHHTDYHMTPQEYLNHYHVTDAMVLKAGSRMAAVIFFCQVGKIVYFENFSYDTDLKKYSPGLLVYKALLEELIKRGCRYLYLGGGEYDYKRRFGAEEYEAYSGTIYRPEVLEEINAFCRREGLEKAAFYGYGVCGHAFLQLASELDIAIAYGIDRCEKSDEKISFFLPEEGWPDADGVFITLNTPNREVEELLKSRFRRVYYWNEVVDECMARYLERGKSDATA